MELSYVHIVAALYSVGGIVTFLGFYPTVRDLYYGKPSANVSTYIIWTGTALIAVLYAATVLRDLTFSLVISLQLFAQIVILFLRIRLLFNEGNRNKRLR